MFAPTTAPKALAFPENPAPRPSPLERVLNLCADGPSANDSFSFPPLEDAAPFPVPVPNTTPTRAQVLGVSETTYSADGVYNPPPVTTEEAVAAATVTPSSVTKTVVSVDTADVRGSTVWVMNSPSGPDHFPPLGALFPQAETPERFPMTAVNAANANADAVSTSTCPMTVSDADSGAEESKPTTAAGAPVVAIAPVVCYSRGHSEAETSYMTPDEEGDTSNLSGIEEEDTAAAAAPAAAAPGRPPIPEAARRRPAPPNGLSASRRRGLRPLPDNSPEAVAANASAARRRPRHSHSHGNAIEDQPHSAAGIKSGEAGQAARLVSRILTTRPGPGPETETAAAAAAAMTTDGSGSECPVSRSDAIVRDVKARLDELRGTVSRAQSDHSTPIAVEVASLQSHLGAALSMNMQLQSLIAQYSALVGPLEGLQDRSREREEALRAEGDRSRELAAEVRKLTLELQFEKTSKVPLLQRQTELHADLETLQRDLLAATSAHMDLQARVKALAASEAEARALKEQLHVRTESESDLTRQLESERAARKALEATVGDLRSGLVSREEVAAARDAEVSAMQTVIALLSRQVDESGAFEKKLMQEAQGFRALNEQLNTQLQSLQSELAAAHDAAAALRSATTGSDAEAQAARAQTAALKKQLEARSADIEALRTAGETTHAALLEVQEELHQTRSGLQQNMLAAQGERDAAAAGLQDALASVALLEERLAAVTAELDGTRARLESEAQARIAAQAERTTLQLQLTAAMDRFEAAEGDLSGQLAAARARVQTLEEALVQAQAQHTVELAAVQSQLALQADAGAASVEALRAREAQGAAELECARKLAAALKSDLASLQSTLQESERAELETRRALERSEASLEAADLRWREMQGARDSLADRLEAAEIAHRQEAHRLALESKVLRRELRKKNAEWTAVQDELKLLSANVEALLGVRLPAPTTPPMPPRSSTSPASSGGISSTGSLPFHLLDSPLSENAASGGTPAFRTAPRRARADLPSPGAPTTTEELLLAMQRLAAVAQSRGILSLGGSAAVRAPVAPKSPLLDRSPNTCQLRTPEAGGGGGKYQSPMPDGGAGFYPQFIMPSASPAGPVDLAMGGVAVAITGGRAGRTRTLLASTVL